MPDKSSKPKAFDSCPPVPQEIVEISGRNLFIPAPGLMSWIGRAYLDEEGPLFNPDHAHLREADIACLWTNAENTRQGRRIVGMAELGTNIGGRQGKWVKARAKFQMHEWFGYEPDFLITIDALYAAGTDSPGFCALIDHELYHCAQDTDHHGMPAFVEATGLPKYCIRGHDVEEFVGVVRRFGIESVASGVELVLAAAQKPEIGPARLGQACGTCLRLAA